jgi:glycosyltransferase involved in cell wall biosynthesis
MPIEKLDAKKVLFVTPSLKLRDGITANSINLMRGWLQSGFQVLVLNPGRMGLESEGLFVSAEDFDSYLIGSYKQLTINESAFMGDTAVIQYAISTYWLRTYWIHKWLKSTSAKKLILCCHEPTREMQILGWIGKRIYKNAFRRSKKIVLFSKQARGLVKTLTSTEIQVCPLPVPRKSLRIGSQSEYPHFLMLGYYLKDKGFELGLNSFLETLKANSSSIVLSVIVSVRQRVGSAKIFSWRDRRDFRKFEIQLKQAKRNFPQNIQIFGYLSDDEMQNVISQSDYLLMPYLGITNSGVAVTAKAHGIPVIASDLEPLIEAFGETGIYFKAGSGIDLKSQLEVVCSNSRWRIERERRAKKMSAQAIAASAAEIAITIAEV